MIVQNKLIQNRALISTSISRCSGERFTALIRGRARQCHSPSSEVIIRGGCVQWDPIVYWYKRIEDIRERLNTRDGLRNKASLAAITWREKILFSLNVKVVY